MNDVQHYKAIFEKYGGMMRTKDLSLEKVFYPKIQKLLKEGQIEKARYGCYQWIDPEDFSEASTVIRLFLDAIL
ncbi:type IV toxin-antitoxin system AbiEi family antitoxin domain-containing protein [Guggenheimella bovis]